MSRVFKLKFTDVTVVTTAIPATAGIVAILGKESV